MAANIHHSSVSVEWYTPEWLIERCRAVLGYIHLDPCSCEEAQKVVKANEWFGMEHDGLAQPWYGNVFMNPPGGWATPEVANAWGSRSNAQCWYAKLKKERQLKRERQRRNLLNGIMSLNAIVLCFNLDTLRALQPKEPICILKSRVKFDRLKDGKRVQGGSPAHGTGLILLSDSVDMRKLWLKEMSLVGTCYEAA